MQNESDEQETPVSLTPGSIICAGLQVPPCLTDTVPARPTAAQKDTVGQEIDNANTARSTSVGCDQPLIAAARAPGSADASHADTNTNAAATRLHHTHTGYPCPRNRAPRDAHGCSRCSGATAVASTPSARVNLVALASGLGLLIGELGRVNASVVARASCRSVVAWWELKDDSFELRERAATEAQCGLEALEPELAGVERAPELVEFGSLVVEYLVARSVQQNQVPRAPEAVRQAHVPLALRSTQTFERQDNGLLCLQPLEDCASEHFARAFLDLAIRDPSG